MLKGHKEFFGEMLRYNEAYFAMVGGDPFTVEQFLPGEFKKYVNNDGIPIKGDMTIKEVVEKAEAVCNFSLTDS